MFNLLFSRFAQDPNPLADEYRDVHMGMHPAMYAWVFATLSGASLPLAAFLGVQFSPVKDKVCALMMAFGAGALLFAVTVELYGHALHQVASGDLGLHEMFTTIAGALCGGAFYLTVNQWLEEYLCEGGEKDAEAGGDGAATETTSLMATLRDQEKDAEAAKAPKSAKALWNKAKMVKVGVSLAKLGKEDLSGLRGRDKALQSLAISDMSSVDDKAKEDKAKSVAFALFLGLLVDGVPEGILMGFLSAEGHLTPVLIISLLVANFPEAFSSASLLIQAKMSTAKILGMWTFLCLLVGGLAGLSCYLLLLAYPNFGQGHGHGSTLPEGVKIGISAVEGITGGAMIACIASVMLPEAFERAGKGGPFYTQSGFLCLSGFLLSASLKALFG